MATTVLIVLLQLTLSILFLFSGFAKIGNPTQLTFALSKLEVSAAPTRVVTPMLPILEVSLAIGILTKTFVFAASVSLAMLLVIFIVVIGDAIRRGIDVECSCFGTLTKGSLSIRTVGRNAFLVAAACILVALTREGHRGIQVGVLIEPLFGSASDLIAIVLMALLAISLLRRSLKRPTEHPNSHSYTGFIDAGLPIGTDISNHILSNSQGEDITLGALIKERPLGLLFLSASCDPCDALIRNRNFFQSESGVDITMVLQGKFDADAVRLVQQFTPSSQVFIDEKRNLSQSLQIFSAPSFVLVDRNARIAGVPLTGEDPIREALNVTRGVATINA